MSEMRKTNRDEIEVINKVEEKYYKEIKDFEKYWYLGERFKHNPFAGYVNAPFKSKTLNISKQGFRGKEFPNKNISNKKRVALFGASGLVGIPVSNDSNNIAGYSNNFFKLNQLNYESLNFGVISARIGNELKLITKVIMEYEIDCVVLMSGFNDASSYTLGSLWEYQDINDIFELGFHTNKNLHNPIFFIQEFLKSIRKRIDVIKAKKLSKKKFRGAENYLRSKRAKVINNIQTHPIYDEGEKLYLQILNQIINLCKYYQKPFIYIFQPSLYNTKKPLSSYEQASFKKQNSFFGDKEEIKNYRINEFNSFYDNFEKKCNDMVLSNNSYVIDVNKKLSLVSDKEDVFYDESHYFEKGNKIIGEEISKFIVKMI